MLLWIRTEIFQTNNDNNAIVKFLFAHGRWYESVFVEHLRK